MTSINKPEDIQNLNSQYESVPKSNKKQELTALEKQEKNLVKSVGNVAELCTGYAGLFAGFEGFIINSYVRSDQLLSISQPIEIGYLFIFLSLFINIAITCFSLMTSGLIKSGVVLGQYWWMKWVIRVCVCSCCISSVLYAIAFQLYVADSVVRPSIKIVIWVISSFMVIFVVFFFIFIFKKSSTTPYKDVEKILEKLE